MSTEPEPKTQLRVGRLTKAHGLKGALKIELYTDEPERRFTPGSVFTLQVPTGSKWRNKTIELIELRWYNSQAVGFFVGIDDRSEAETLVKAILWVEQDPTDLPDEDDAWYDHQLVGLAVHRDGVLVGTVARVEHMPAQDLLIVKTDDGEVMVPFVKAIVPSVDIAAGIVTVTPPTGLFEEIPDTGEPEPETSQPSKRGPAKHAAEDESTEDESSADESVADESSDESDEAPAEAAPATAETTTED
ncbi:ribosome maturation factor RimM [Plantibacter sp. YIM 135249]|uniref:ribosome maturation factor RimM n=1 Tax=Plantibacter sp. YIM 135249 TaxID=3423918 RepID=UPI003D34B4F1